MSDLPHGWSHIALGDLCSEGYGSVVASPTSVYELYSVPAFPSGRPEIIKGSKIGSAKRPVEPNDVLLCKINPRINRVWIVGPKDSHPQIASTEFLPLRLPDGFADTARYLMWYLRSPRFRAWIKLNAEGATGSHTRAKSQQILRQVVPIAPLAEQEQIVATIEEQFSRLDAGVAVLEKMIHDLDHMRAASFLKLHTESLMASDPRPLEKVCKFIVDGDHNPPKRTDDGIPYLTAKHVKQGRISTHGASFISGDDFASLRRRYDPQKGDVLVTCVGTLGEVAIVPDGLVFAADRNLAAIRPSLELLPAFLEAMLRSPRIQKVLTTGSGSTAQPHLYLRDLRHLEIPVPSIDTQESLITTLHEQLAFADQLEADVTAALLRAQRLHSSILAAAFSGNLVAQDANEESASVLLQRIAAARAPFNAHRPRRGRKPRVLPEEVTA